MRAGGISMQLGATRMCQISGWECLFTPPQNKNLDSKIHHLRASELKFYDVRRAQIFNISNFCWGLFEKRPFLVFCLLKTIFFIFGPFFGVGQFFLVSRHYGGHHRSILILDFFIFWPSLAIFFAVFAFLGHFCIFKWFQENQ